MRYILTFAESDRLDEEIDLTDPKIGDVLKILDPSGENLEYWTISAVEAATIVLRS